MLVFWWEILLFYDIFYTIRIMKRLYLFICIFLGLYSSQIYAQESSGVGESMDLWFYSKISKNADAITKTFTRKELSKYNTFKGFGSICRPAYPWLDTEKMDETLLIELQHGSFAGITRIMGKKKVTMTSDTLLQLARCLSETYSNIWTRSQKDGEFVNQMGAVGLYSDGNTENSDYDIVADIEKIHSIIFIDKMKYDGNSNSVKSWYQNIVWWWRIPTLAWIPVPTNKNGTYNEDPKNNNNTSSENIANLENLWIGNICSASQSQTNTVANMMDDSFMDELWSFMAGNNNNAGHSYGQNPLIENNNQNKNQKPEKNDFFHTPPCTGNFCIRIKTVSWWSSLFGSAKSNTIEDLFEKHSKIMEPIANSNLAYQKFSKNSFELSFKWMKFKDLLAGLQVSVESLPQENKRYSKEYTQEELNKEFLEMQKCAYVTAGLPSDTKRANILWGVGYDTSAPQTSESIKGKIKNISTISPDDQDLTDCMPVARSQNPMKYNQSISSDLTELEVFSFALLDMLDNALMEHRKLDNLPAK